MPADGTALITETVSASFSRDGARGLSHLRKHLENQMSLQRVPLRTIADVQMDITGRVQGRYRFSSEGLLQLCGCAATYFGRWFYSLLGDDVAGMDQFTFAMAVRHFNDVLRLRFQSIEGLSLLVDAKANRIDGVLGSRYELFSNVHLLDLIERAAAASPLAMEFHSALVEGRRLAVWYVTQQPMLGLRCSDGIERYHVGCYVGNSEVGDKSIVGARAIFHPPTGAWLTEPRRDGARIIHLRQRSLGKRCEDMLEQLFQLGDYAGVASRALAAASSATLGFQEDLAQCRERYQYLRTKLARRNCLTREQASRALHHTLCSGRSGPAAGQQAAVWEPRLLSRLPGRSVLDLACNVSLAGKERSLPYRERTEAFAYRLAHQPSLVQ